MGGFVLYYICERNNKGICRDNQKVFKCRYGKAWQNYGKIDWYCIKRCACTDYQTG